MAYFNIIKWENISLDDAVFEGSQYPYKTKIDALTALAKRFDSSDETGCYLYTMKCDCDGVEVLKLHKQLDRILDDFAEQELENNPEAYFVDDRGDLVRGD